jgi:RND family efflux transporter MFP subunit
MKRIAALIGMVVVAAAGFLILGNSRSAEGPGHSGGVTTAAAPAANGPNGAPQAVAVIAAPVVSRDLRQTLEVTGSLRTDDDVQISSRIAGKVVRVTVKEGDRVSRGHVLVQLDDRELRAQIARAQGTLSSARARLSLARNQATWKDTSARSGHESADAALAAARTRVQQAETNLNLVEHETATRVQDGQAALRVANYRLSIARELTRKQELAQAQLTVNQASAQMDQARVDVENARRMFERRQALYKQDAIAKEEMDESERRFKTSEAAYRVAEAAVSVARQRLELAREGSRPEDVRVAEEGVRTAQLTLDQALADQRNRRQVARDDVEAAKAAEQQAEAALRSARAGLVQSKMSVDEINSARAAIAQAEADIQFYRTQLADLTIRAPVSGVVSTRLVNAGETITVGARLMDLVALDTVFFEAVVPELEVGLLRPGAEARVTVDAMPGQNLRGAVREIIPVADRTSRAFRVRIGVLGAKGALPAGGYARARVHVGNRPGAVAVAKDAVYTEAGDKYVWLISEGESGRVAKRQIIRVGLVDDRFAEVLDGLQPGQQVVAAGSPAIVEGTPISVGSGS